MQDTIPKKVRPVRSHSDSGPLEPDLTRRTRVNSLQESFLRGPIRHPSGFRGTKTCAVCRVRNGSKSADEHRAEDRIRLPPNGVKARGLSRNHSVVTLRLPRCGLRCSEAGHDQQQDSERHLGGRYSFAAKSSMTMASPRSA